MTVATATATADRRTRVAHAVAGSRRRFWLANLGGLLAGVATLFVGALLLAQLLAPAADPPIQHTTQVRSLPPPEQDLAQSRPSDQRPQPTRQQPLPTPPLPQLALPALDQALELPAIATDSETVAWAPSAPALPAMPTMLAGGSGDAPARRLITPDLSADYPRRARRRGIEGRSTMRLQIDAQGEVTAVEVVASEPAGIFERAARRAARRLHYEPALDDGRPVASEVQEIFVWSLR